MTIFGRTAQRRVRYPRRVIRLICIDVDGTLVGSSGTVLPQVWVAAERVRAQGIRLAICSGRPAFGLTRDFAERLDAEGWHVFQNGASVMHLPTGKSMSSRLAPEAVKMLIDRARSSGRVLELYTDTEYAVESSADAAREHARLLGVPFAARAYESLRGSIVRGQWVLTHDQVDLTLSEPHPGLEVSPAASPVMPLTTFVNLTTTGVSKASAVREVAAAYGIPLEQVMMVGDGRNDVATMKEVGFPVAMGNSDPEVHEVARLTVGHVDDGGLTEALAAAQS
jgi:Cof subfamily protein (haloacid dehalogenase superfamily)